MFKFLFKGSSDRNYDVTDVKVGDRYFQVGGTERRWIVDRIIKPIVSEVPHVVIVKESNRQTNKMVSISALLDTSIFRIERRDTGDDSVERENKARRKTDTKVSP